MNKKILFKIKNKILLGILLVILLFLGVRGIYLDNNPILQSRTVNMYEVNSINELSAYDRTEAYPLIYYLKPQSIKHIKHYDYQYKYGNYVDQHRLSNFVYINSESKLGKSVKRMHPTVKDYSILKLSGSLINFDTEDDMTNSMLMRGNIKPISRIILNISQILDYILLIYLIFSCYMGIKIEQRNKNDVEITMGYIILSLSFVMLSYIIFDIFNLA